MNDDALNTLTARATALVGTTVTVRLRGGGADVTGTLTAFAGSAPAWPAGTAAPKACLTVTETSGGKVWTVRVDEVAAIGA
ncbi:hypothetical protein [Kitasatospora sp. NE20-6]|uniref:hypothetical protein n=1 Tax=Kitasatospora sp. NE20-6 TaxID=2859066 RepID=UPI0038B327F8